MKKTILLLCACLASWYAGAQNEAKFLQGESMTRVDKTSPGGKYVVGYSLESQPWGARLADRLQELLMER